MFRRRGPSDFALSDVHHGDSEKQSLPHGNHRQVLTEEEVDMGAQFVAGLSIDSEVDPAEAARVRRKIDYYILPMMCTLYWVQYVDKTTLGSASILGILQGARLSTNQYNWLGTMFYIGYFVFQYPQNLALQRFPVGRWMSINVFVWAISLICQAACTNFVALSVCRIFLGICEGSTAAGFMIVTSMFYTRKEQMLRVGYWYLMNGIAQIISGFISFGSLHIETPGFAPWQWLMIITGIITLIVAVTYWFFFPDSPTNAWFLTPSERVIALLRVKENQTGVGNKHFKNDQMIEALLDPKTWLFALFSAIQNILASLTNQRQIIMSSFGFSNLDTTLLDCADGAVRIVSIWTAVMLAVWIPKGRAYVAILYFALPLAGAFMIEFLPWSDQVGLLFGVWLADSGMANFVVALSWLNNVTAGHTKRITTNAVMFSAYCIGSAVGPLMWQSKYKPRNRVPWLIIGISCIVCPILLLIIRWMLARENARREAEPIEPEEEYFIEKETEEGGRMYLKVDKAFMDLTDRQNRDFRYVL